MSTAVTLEPSQAPSFKPRWTELPATPVAAAKLADLDALLLRIAEQHPTAALASSLSPEDMLLTDRIASLRVPITVFTLNTGRLHAQTLALVDRVQSRYGLTIEVMHPQAQAVQRYVREHGADAFYESIDLRKACCNIRKVEPLKRALEGRTAWLTGQRRDQAVTRVELPIEGHDDVTGLTKFNPLAAWSEAEVWTLVRTNLVPYNPLHDQGYPSIGCEPCTRAIASGEDPRAGRWWWETPEQKECGLHVGPDGRLQRAKKD